MKIKCRKLEARKLRRPCEDPPCSHETELEVLDMKSKLNGDFLKGGQPLQHLIDKKIKDGSG